jgi:putative transposase
MKAAVAQLPLTFRTWGGRRAGAGRKRNPGSTRNVPHSRRPTHCARHPVHVTMRLSRGLPNLREQALSSLITQAYRDGRRLDFRFVHHSIQATHLHILVESDDRTALSRGAAGIAARIARRLNRRLGRHGKVFPDRFHLRSLRTPREVRNVLVYVLLNVRKHGGRSAGIDPRSSGAAFDGWRWPDARTRRADHPASDLREIAGVQAATTWLLRCGWRRCGLIALTEQPMSQRL